MSDTALLWLLGEDEIKFNDEGTEEQFHPVRTSRRYSATTSGGGAQETASGNLCAAQIGNSNGFVTS